MSKKYLSPKIIKLITVSFICVGLIVLNPREVFNPIRSFIFQLAYPFEKVFYAFSGGISGTVDFLSSISELKEENEKLLIENNFLNAELASLKEQKKENEMLREQLNLLPRDRFDLEAAFVIGRNPQRSGSWIMLDKGRDSGLEAGDPVIISNGILIGKVIEIFADTAKVNLISDSGSSVNAVDLETEAKGIIKGEYGLGLTMDMVDQSDALNPGDTIVTSGLGGEFPKGLLIGKIQEVHSSGDKLFQRALVVPRVKYSKLEAVFVIKNN